jgi:hypothetical protein
LLRYMKAVLWKPRSFVHANDEPDCCRPVLSYYSHGHLIHSNQPVPMELRGNSTIFKQYNTHGTR